MSKITLDNLIVPEVDDPFDHTECHLWLPVEEAQAVARHLINMNAFFTYLPDPGNDGSAEIISFDDDLNKILTITVEVKL